MVSKAGVEHFGALDTITEADFDRVFQTNVAGQLFVTQAAVPAMTGGGRIVLSASASVRLSVYHHALYAASKAATPAVVRNLAPELAGRNIAINAISPGATATAMALRYGADYTHPALAGVPFEALLRSMSALGRFAQPDDIAAVVAVLLSPEAAHITGTTIETDGGWHCPCRSTDLHRNPVTSHSHRREPLCSLSSPEHRGVSAGSSSSSASPAERRPSGSWPPAEPSTSSPTSHSAGSRCGAPTSPTRPPSTTLSPAPTRCCWFRRPRSGSGSTTPATPSTPQPGRV